MELETAAKHPLHFEDCHSEDETDICLTRDGSCAVGIAIKAPETQERQDFESAIKNSLERVEAYLGTNHDTSVAELFQGLFIEIGDDLTPSGGQAFVEKNKIVFDRQKMRKSLAAAEAELIEIGWLNEGDWTATMDETSSSRPASCLEYNLAHELAHILFDESEAEVPADTTSPTKLGEEKPKESIAESYARLVFGVDIPADTKAFIDTKIQERVARMRLNPKIGI